MKKQRDFLDYVSLGSQLLQNVQLHSVQEQLSVSNQLEAARLQIEHLEATGRDFIFQAQEMVEGLIESHVGTNPCGTLNIALNLKKSLAACGITTKNFRSFEDKKGLQRLSGDLDDLIAECELKLDQMGKEVAIASVKYQAEESDLLSLIDALSIQEELEPKKKELASIPDEKRSSLKLVGVFLMVIAVGIAIFGVGNSVAKFFDMTGPLDLSFELGILVLPVWYS